MMKKTIQGSLSQEGSIPGSPSTLTSPSESLKMPFQQQMLSTTQPVLSQTGRGPSLFGLIAAKRFTTKLQNKYHRSNSMFSSSKRSTSIQIKKEPTYKMEPEKRFSRVEVENVVRKVIDSKMKGFNYHPKICSNICKVLSDEIKDEIKKLKYDRYKLVVVVYIGEKKDQCALVASRCAWDSHLDDYVTYSIATGFFFCTACVYMVYNE